MPKCLTRALANTAACGGAGLTCGGWQLKGRGDASRITSLSMEELGEQVLCEPLQCCSGSGDSSYYVQSSGRQQERCRAA